MLLSALIYHFNGTLKGVFCNGASLFCIAHYLIVEDGEVEGESEAHRVKRQNAAVLPIAELKRLLVGVQCALLEARQSLL